MISNSFDRRVSLAGVVQRQPLILPAETPVQDAIRSMYQNRSSSVLVTEQQRLVGILTEEDVVWATATSNSLLESKLSHLTTRRVITIAEAVADIHTVWKRLHRLRHLPIVDRHHHPVGMITPKSLCRTLRPDLLKRRRVAEAMNTSILQATASVSLRDLVMLMSTYQAEAVVIVSGADRLPIGIVTQPDIVKFQALETDFDQVQSKAVMGTLITIEPQATLWDAYQHQVDHLVVVGADGVVGTITSADLIALNLVDSDRVIQDL